LDSEYKMLRTKGGKTAFAIVGVTAHEGQGIRWHESLSIVRRLYETPVETGIERALREHMERGGPNRSIEVTKLVESPSDTKEDAVRCASALATWKALGHLESESRIVFQGENWDVLFPRDSFGHEF